MFAQYYPEIVWYCQNCEEVFSLVPWKGEKVKPKKDLVKDLYNPLLRAIDITKQNRAWWNYYCKDSKVLGKHERK